MMVFLQVKFLQNFSRFVMIGFLTLSINIEKVLIHQVRSQIIENVERRILVSDLLGRTIVLDVVRVSTRLGISLI